MESLLYQQKNYIDTENLLYNIINSNEPKNIFMYSVIIIIGIYISINITFNYNIFIGLIFCSLIIYYFYTWDKYNYLSRSSIDKEKFNLLFTKNQILQKYPYIVDFLYYFENFKSNNLQQYENLIIAFENFVKIYEYCILDNTLITKFYSTLNAQKLYIMNIINIFIFTQNRLDYDKIILAQQLQAEKILNKFLNVLVVLNKKKIYYDGYNNNTNIIDTSNILPYNIFYDTNSKYSNLQYNISNLLTY